MTKKLTPWITIVESGITIPYAPDEVVNFGAKSLGSTEFPALCQRLFAFGLTGK
ncbi:MAG: hypothetical protein H0S80_06630 [Desulfovibrionaceae bacterium]|nr:hypothetical protein [Desulfovibrionaceae bacterium]